MRQPKGSVTVEVFRDRLRLRLPRQIYGGQKKYLSLGLSDTVINRQAALAKAKQIEADIALERFDPTLDKYRSPTYAAPPDLPDLPLLTDLWQQYTEFKSKTLSSTTLTKDFKKIGNHIAGLPTQELVNAKKIRLHLQDNLTPDAARRVLMQIKACCQWAYQEEIIPDNPFFNLKLSHRIPKTNSINPFSGTERDMITAAFQADSYYSYYTPFVKFLFLTGCRTSEAIALQWQHIDPSLTMITFTDAVVEGIRKDTKTHKSRRFPVNPSLKKLILQVRPGEPTADQTVFTAKEGGLIDPHNFLNRAWKSVLAKLPITYRPQYNTRHTFITLCLEAGVPVTQISSWVGNSPKTIWQHYAGLVSTIEVPDI
jgi:integrase